jgi:hypothetical protein
MTYTAIRDFELTSGSERWMHRFAYGEVRYTYTVIAGCKAVTWVNASGGYSPAEMPEVVVSGIHIRLAPGKDWTPIDGWLWELLREVPDAWFIEQLAEADDA